jgi:hypothetical protein
MLNARGRLRCSLLPIQVLLLVSVPSFGQALDADQQRCVNGLNTGGARVNKAQNRESLRCWKLCQKGKEPSAEACWLSDPRQKVSKAAEKVFDREPGLCGGITPPPFAYTSAFIVVAAGREQSLFFLQDLYGVAPDSAAGLGAGDRDVARCQQEAIKRGHKVEETLLKTANKTKKRYLKGSRQVPPVSDASSLATMITSMILGDGKLEKQGQKLEDRVEKRCSVLGASTLQGAFPGCDVATTSELAGCVLAAARCRGCWKLNLMDDLTLDCDLLDDFQANTSCIGAPPTGTPTPSSGLTPTSGPAPTSGPTPTLAPTPALTTMSGPTFSGVNPNPGLSGGRAQLDTAASCFGADSHDTGGVTLAAVGGSGTYVQRVLTSTATRTT